MRIVARLWRYISRSRARGAWVMFSLAALLYALYPANYLIYETVRSASLIVASIGLSTIFLPELSTDLWSLKASEIRALIPNEKVNELQRAIIQSRVRPEEWADCIVGSAIEPLAATEAQPEIVMFDVSYLVTVHPSCSRALGEKDLKLSLFECSHRATRRLPARGHGDVVWVSLARDYLALQHEYREPGCIYREVSEIEDRLSDEEWRGIAQKYCAARIVIDGVAVEATMEPPYEGLVSPNPRVVRWFFTAANFEKAVVEPHRVEIHFDYVQHEGVSSFPAMFSSYYIADGLRFGFSVYPPEGFRCVLSHETFIAQALPHVMDESLHEKALGQELRIVTSDNGIVWPGSGIHVSWRLTPVAVGASSATSSSAKEGSA